MNINMIINMDSNICIAIWIAIWIEHIDSKPEDFGSLRTNDREMIYYLKTINIMQMSHRTILRHI